MLVCLFGSEGMLGSAIKKELGRARIDHICTKGHRDLDVTDLGAIEAFAEAHPFTHIINATAYTKVDKAEEEEELAHSVNAQGAENLATVARKYGAKFMHFSTDYVFNGKSKTSYTEDAPCFPLNVYGRSKLEGERIINSLLPKACIIRTSGLFGLKGKNFVSNLLHSMQEKDTLKVVDDQIRRPTFAADLAKAACLMLEESGTYHFANSGIATWFDFASYFHELCQKKGVPLKCKTVERAAPGEFPIQAARPINCVLATTRIEQKLGYSPRSWQEALEDYLDRLMQPV